MVLQDPFIECGHFLRSDAVFLRTESRKFFYFITGTVMQIENAMINDRLRV